MMKYIAVAVVILFVSISVDAKTLTIGIDLSGSNPLLIHKNFAHTASQYVSAEIGKLKNGDVVQLKTFGARQNVANILNYNVVISRRVSTKRVAQLITQYIRAIPEQKDVSQASTNLVSWLEFTSGFGCKDSGQILVITDGLESSSLVDGRALLEGTAGLPKPEVDLQGCALIFYGLGAGWPAQSVRTLRNEWRKWSEQAGATFDALII